MKAPPDVTVHSFISCLDFHGFSLRRDPSTSVLFLALCRMPMHTTQGIENHQPVILQVSLKGFSGELKPDQIRIERARVPEGVSKWHRPARPCLRTTCRTKSHQCCPSWSVCPVVSYRNMKLHLQYNMHWEQTIVIIADELVQSG